MPRVFQYCRPFSKIYWGDNTEGQDKSCWGDNTGVLATSIAVKQKGKRKVQGVPQSQTAALPRHQEEEETEKSKQAQIEQTYEKH